MVRRGVARRGGAWQGMARGQSSMVRGTKQNCRFRQLTGHGSARQGKAGLGVARRGLARYGEGTEFHGAGDETELSIPTVDEMRRG
jgi:hypothetical protein